MMTDNIFLKIINRQIPATIAYEDDHCLAFHDINPQAPIHVLIIPKKVIVAHDEIAAEDGELLGRMHVAAARLARDLGLNDGYRLAIHRREKAGHTVPHLPMHLVGGRSLPWPPG